MERALALCEEVRFSCSTATLSIPLGWIQVSMPKENPSNLILSSFFLTLIFLFPICFT
jgi:hypothetical protein